MAERTGATGNSENAFDAVKAATVSVATSAYTKYISPRDVHPVFPYFKFALFRPGGARATSEPAQREFLGVLFRKRSTFVQVNPMAGQVARVREP